MADATTTTATPRPRRQVWRRWRRALVFVAVQLVLLIAVLEVGLRLLRPRQEGLRALLYRSTVATDLASVATLPELMKTSLLGYRPFEVHRGFVLNSRGLRTREYSEDKPAGVWRLLAIGDSITYGVVPDADVWTSRLEAELAAQRRGGVEVLRLGVPGTGTPFQLRLWQLEGARLGADAVVLAFFVGNDFFDELGNGPGWEGRWQRLATVSYSFRLVRNVFRLWRSGGGGGVLAPPAQGEPGLVPGTELPGFSQSFDESRPTFSPEAYREIEAERLSLCLRAERWKLALRLARVGELIERFDWEVRRSGARFVVMIIPDEAQVDPEVRAVAMAAAGHGAEDYDLDLPQRELGDFLAARGIAALDLLPAFRERGARERLYLLRDSHWNRAGNRLAAEVLAAALAGGSDGSGS